MHLLEYQLTFLEEAQEDRDEIKDVAQFVGLFYAERFLKGYLSADAAMNDLNAILQMHKYSKFQSAARKCIESLVRHLNYLSPELIVLCLASKLVSNDEKKLIAEKLLQFDVPYRFLHQTSPTLQASFATNPESWSDSLPPFLSLISEDSWFVFHVLELLPDKVSWLKNHPIMWSSDPNYIEFEYLARGLSVVNDAA